jgi:hypothetical protein
MKAAPLVAGIVGAVLIGSVLIWPSDIPPLPSAPWVRQAPIVLRLPELDGGTHVMAWDGVGWVKVDATPRELVPWLASSGHPYDIDVSPGAWAPSDGIAGSTTPLHVASLPDSDVRALSADVEGRLFVHVLEDAQTKAELIRFLRAMAEIDPGLLRMLGYVGDDGDVHALTEADLRRTEL